MTPIHYTCGVLRRKCRQAFTIAFAKRNNFTRHMRYSSESVQWLDHFRNANIVHAKNSVHGEVRIENYSVDGFDSTTNTVYEYYGCYHHDHTACNESHDAKKWEKAMQREADLKALGHNVISITSCEWFAMEESEVWYHPAATTAAASCSMEDILDAVKCEEIFGFIQCSIHVPLHLIDKFLNSPRYPKTLRLLWRILVNICRRTAEISGVSHA